MSAGARSAARALRLRAASETRGRGVRRGAKLPVAPPSELVRLHSAEEIARFLKEQPPMPVPPRSFAPILPGLIAFSVLGARIVRCGGSSDADA